MSRSKQEEFFEWSVALARGGFVICLAGALGWCVIRWAMK